MHRTQILLEEGQYEMLKTAAEREGRSVSSLVREAVTAFLGKHRRSNSKGLAEIAGVGEDNAASGRRHDRILYGPRSRRS
jgi:hypothetical protein